MGWRVPADRSLMTILTICGGTVAAGAVGFVLWVQWVIRGIDVDGPDYG